MSTSAPVPARETSSRAGIAAGQFRDRRDRFGEDATCTRRRRTRGRPHPNAGVSRRRPSFLSFARTNDGSQRAAHRARRPLVRIGRPGRPGGRLGGAFGRGIGRSARTAEADDGRLHVALPGRYRRDVRAMPRLGAVAAATDRPVETPAGSDRVADDVLGTEIAAKTIPTTLQGRSPRRLPVRPLTTKRPASPRRRMPAPRSGRGTCSYSPATRVRASRTRRERRDRAGPAALASRSKRRRSAAQGAPRRAASAEAATADGLVIVDEDRSVADDSPEDRRRGASVPRSRRLSCGAPFPPGRRATGGDEESGRRREPPHASRPSGRVRRRRTLPDETLRVTVLLGKPFSPAVNGMR